MVGTRDAGSGDANVQLGELLREAMTGHGMNQAALAKKADISPAAVSNAMNPAKGVPSVDTLDRLARVLGFKGDSLSTLYTLRGHADVRKRRLDDYLTAAARAASDHPYPGVLPGTPPLAEVYVRQQATLRRSAPVSLPVDKILAGHEMCVVLAEPGGGKSSLLRTLLADGAERGLRGTNEDGIAVPILVPAAALTGLPLAQALAAAATVALAPWLLEGLPAGFFSAPPAPKAGWLLLVDGLDEVTDPASRRRVLDTLAGIGKGEYGGQYSFVVATRPLPDGELDALQVKVSLYELEPFKPEDLLRVARGWFDKLALHDPDGVAERFIRALARANLVDLARIPLMASLLCQLHAAAPDQPLPASRGQIYQDFITLLHKRQYAAPRQLGLERYGSSATDQADRVLDHLPDLIDQLAAERRAGNTRPAVTIVESQPETARPPRVPPDEWQAFLGTCLRQSGLLTVSAGRYNFLHPTLLEYLAARHATRNPQTPLRDVFRQPRRYMPGIEIPGLKPQMRFRRYWAPPREEPSYVGFLLDAVHERDRAAGTQFLNRLATRGGLYGCNFIADQARMGTHLPTNVTHTAADLLHTLTRDTTLRADFRMTAAQGLAWLGDRRACDVFEFLARDTTLRSDARTEAAQALAESGDVRAPDVFFALALDTTLLSDARTEAAQALAESGDARAADVFEALADDSTLDSYCRRLAAGALAESGDVRAPDVFFALALDTTLLSHVRKDAAQALARRGDSRAPDLLHSLARDTGIDDYARTAAAWTLAEMRDPRSPFLLHALTRDTTLRGYSRTVAAQILAWLGDPRASDVFHALALDTTVDRSSRREAAQALARRGDGRAPKLCHTLALETAPYRPAT